MPLAGLRRRCRCDQRQAAIRNMNGHAERQFDLFRPSAAQHGRAYDEATAPDALHIDGAATVFDNPINPNPRAVDKGDLTQAHRPLDRPA